MKDLVGINFSEQKNYYCLLQCNGTKGLCSVGKNIFQGLVCQTVSFFIIIETALMLIYQPFTLIEALSVLFLKAHSR
jgi:hypothetical protein